MATTQYNNTAKMPDITGLITNISPYDTPLMSLFGKGERATQVIHSWEEEELGDPRDNAQVEGFTYTTEEPGDTSLKENVTQIFSRGYKVTDTSQVIKRRNIKDFMGRKMQQAMKLIALDVERAITTSTKQVRGNKSTARRMAGLQYYIKTNILSNSGTARDLTLTLLNDAFEQIYKAGGNPDVIVVSPRNKRILSALLPLNTDRTTPMTDKKITMVINTIEGDFGKKRILINRWMDDTKLFILQSEYCKLSYLRPFKTVTLPKTASATEKVIEGELTLEVRAEKAQGIITDLNGELPTV